MKVLVEIYGVVQGVGFRSFLRRNALKLGVRGYARNRADGSVEAIFDGEANAVAQLVLCSLRGPPLARVERVTIKPIEESEEYEGFAIR